MNILGKNLLILASAGSGKTYQLANRVIGLVAKGVAPEKIVALTFTRKAAGEFADSVLTKLAKAASNGQEAALLREELGLPEADFGEALEKVARVLPRLTLGTMDSFFSKVVRGFQYELGLTGGKFDLLEGARAQAAADELLAEILGEALDDGSGEDFMHAFRRASFGKEEQGVARGFGGFVGIWHGRYRGSRNIEWGPEFLAGARVEDWEQQKHELFAKVTRGLDLIEYPRKDARAALEKALETLVRHTTGSGSLGSAAGLLGSILEAAGRADGPVRVKYHKEFIIPGPSGEALREMVILAARCEMAAALLRTRAVREIIGVYDTRREKQLRRRGLLGFDDVKLLMGEWALGEEARLRRELVDFRLDARHDHWLLDEFQDTSRADWLGLLPLVDEAAGEGEGSLFIVGDRKQSIYAWRGGEVKLFDEVGDRYRGGLGMESMAESWRSCPEVLALVNRVCGDTGTMRELFGKAAGHWVWEDHFPAARLATPEKRGEARVEVLDPKHDDLLERLSGLLEELGIGKRPVTCGVLVRSNTQVRRIADDLRAKGFDVIEEGRREPSKDNPVGIALAHLLKWLANPADTYSWRVMEMSPLLAPLRLRFGESWQAVWEGLSAVVSRSGFAAMAEEILEEHWAGWSDFGRRRASDLLSALADLDASGEATMQEAAEWISRLEVSQSPGVAAVQVMTIHKSKGLGFDVVILPEVPNDSIPTTQHFDVAEGNGWLTQTPPKWTRELIPEMREAESLWGEAQCYQDFCMLYVALTRAKRGLYVFLQTPATSQPAEKPSLANWLARSVEAEGRTGVVFQSGSPDWVEFIARSKPTKAAEPVPELAPAPASRIKKNPSQAKEPPACEDEAKETEEGSETARAFGSEVHALLERVGWVDEEAPMLPGTDAGKRVARLLSNPSTRAVFERSGRTIELYREQAVDSVNGDQWISGTIDRLHVHRDPAGQATRVEVIDFKTDSPADPALAVARYGRQMEAYQDIIGRAFPGSEVECFLLLTSGPELVATKKAGTP